MNSAYLGQHIERLQSRKTNTLRYLRIFAVCCLMIFAPWSVVAFASGDEPTSLRDAFFPTLVLASFFSILATFSMAHRNLKETIELLQVLQRTVGEDTQAEA